MDDIEDIVVASSPAREAIKYARRHSYYYRHHYQFIPDDDAYSLEELPITDLDDYWKLAKADLANVLSAPLVEGRVICDGGPGTVHFTKSELHDNSRMKAMVWGALLNLMKGERVASLASPIELQAGFWDTINMYTGLMVPLESIQILISNEQPTGGIAAAVERFRPTVLIASPDDLVRLTEYFGASHTAVLSVRAVIYLGHKLPRDLHSSWLGTFPKAKLYPLLYAPLDIGPLGVPAPITTCEDTDADPTYCALNETALLEIVADDGTVIKQPGVKGNLIVTHLTRRLQPIIRYPVGDVAAWVDYGGWLFTYHGRASPKLKLAGTTLDCALVKAIVDEAMGTDTRGRAQFVLCSENNRPKLVVRLAFPVPQNPGQLRHGIEAALWKASPDWKRDRLANMILSLRLDWVGEDQLDRDEASGKVKEIVDERLASEFDTVVGV
ncbi:hypothetical protein F4821DRAFT_276891 [Hypoxylon rubiginosum]|uniref:Uncharacterized protein n=1 Tax=Hypoxylon rubiginosum TaxID=110542 RepID=A0ACC0DKK6_9PEZI|nr:hypothetical protein F4821DRAFT_276891 [Hypoxylon rubiginosum]